VTKDRKLSAQWEHMVAVTEDGVDVLTLSAADAALLTSGDVSMLASGQRPPA
jgi:methionyl aminopeptidase